MKAVVDGVNIFNPVKDKMDKIIECFVEFYGEKYRERITTKLKNARYFFVPREGNFNISGRIHTYYNNKITELENELFFSFPNYEPNKCLVFNITIAKAIESRLLLGKLNDSDYLIIDDIIESFGLDMGSALFKNSKNRVDSETWLRNQKNFDKLKSFLTNVINEWNTHYASTAEKLNKERKSALFWVEDFDKIIEGNKARTETRLRRVAICYLIENRESIKNADEAKMVKNIDTYVSLLKMGKEEFLRKGKFYCNFFKQCIEFFNALGYNLGDDIMEYKNNKELIDLLFNYDIQAHFDQELNIAKEVEYVNNPYILDAYLNMQKIKCKFDDQSHIINMLAFAARKSRGEAFIHNYISPDNKLISICVCGDGLDVGADSLFHEMNHIIESDLLSVDNDGFITKSGFDIVEFNEKKQTSAKSSHRKYELLNEVINDYFALKISKTAQAKGYNICFGENSQSRYALAFPLLEDFINKYKEELIEARMSNNPFKFAKVFGKEKYERLVSLVNKYFEILLDDNKRTRALVDFTFKTGEMGWPLNNIDSYSKMNVNWVDEAKEIINCYREIKRITEDDLSIKKEQDNRKYIVATTIKKDDREK